MLLGIKCSESKNGTGEGGLGVWMREGECHTFEKDGQGRLHQKITFQEVSQEVKE